MDERFCRNLPTLTAQEQSALGGKTVFLAGLGGLGGFAAEYLARAGVGTLICADCDCFEASNRNRQLLSLESNLGRSKAEAAGDRIREINPAARVILVRTRLDEENLPELLRGCDLAVDALDGVPARLALENACAALGIPLVHGAVHGWAAQAAVVLPGSGLLRTLYSGGGGDADSSVLSPVPGLCAAVQCAEAVKLLTGRPTALAGKLLVMDLQAMEFSEIEF